jgi:hypothetical protein
MNQKLLTLKQVTAVFPVSYARVSAAAREGILPVVRLGRQVFVDPERLKEFIDGGGRAYPGGWRREAPGA